MKLLVLPFTILWGQAQGGDTVVTNNIINVMLRALSLYLSKDFCVGLDKVPNTFLWFSECGDVEGCDYCASHRDLNIMGKFEDYKDPEGQDID